MSSTCEAAEVAVGGADRGFRHRTLVSLFTSKWSASAIETLEDGPLRFGELQRRLQGVSPKVLTQTLRRLEEFGLVNRVVYPDIPLRVEYSLTDVGRGAAELLQELRNWVDEVVRTTSPEEARDSGVGS
ncbi:winged helix-turn-helix transcriptional regulator [Amycolatopsis sp. cmx-4-68]|uniref:winged helix-turn-helix transcriptional regulator n=1 Tax=Amycolatopsis sp. cmx-4-68 TaxID=2790938 RepID=UPI00397ACBB9